MQRGDLIDRFGFTKLNSAGQSGWITGFEKYASERNTEKSIKVTCMDWRIISVAIARKACSRQECVSL
jgi:hypothetical protein